MNDSPLKTSANIKCNHQPHGGGEGGTRTALPGGGATLAPITPNTKCKTWPYWLPVVLYATVIFWLSSRPSSDFPPLFPYADKVVHLLLYTGFAFFVARAMSVQFARVDRFTIWMSIVVTAIYGATDEWHQCYVPTRSCELGDWTADLIGAVIGSFLYVIYNYKTLQRYLALKERMAKNP